MSDEQPSSVGGFRPLLDGLPDTVPINVTGTISDTTGQPHDPRGWRQLNRRSTPGTIAGVSARLRVEGLTVPSGTSANFARWSQMQATVMPVVSLQEGYLECWGSAACVGNAGWFITAEHVVEDFIALRTPR